METGPKKNVHLIILVSPRIGWCRFHLSFLWTHISKLACCYSWYAWFPAFPPEVSQPGYFAKLILANDELISG